MSATIPITLQAVPVPIGISAADINQLLTIIAQFMSASINQDVSFFQTVSADPTQKTTDIIFNEAQGIFKQWSVGIGAYVAITENQPGDIKSSFVAGDSPQTGWIICDGRTISGIQGISQSQLSVLNQLFGIGGSLPTLTAQVLSGLPATGTFSGITITDITPPQSQIGNLPFSGTYNPVEEQNLAANTETLRGSTANLKSSTQAIATASEALLAALRNATSAGLYTSVFVGYPA